MKELAEEAELMEGKAKPIRAELCDDDETATFLRSNGPKDRSSTSAGLGPSSCLEVIDLSGSYEESTITSAELVSKVTAMD